MTGLDSVYCFTPETNCNVVFSITPSAGTIGAIAVTKNVACSLAPTACAAGEAVTGTMGTTALTPSIALTAGQMICVYLSSTQTTTGIAELYSTSGLAGCGMLPVEVHKFTVNEEEAEKDE